MKLEKFTGKIYLGKFWLIITALVSSCNQGHLNKVQFNEVENENEKISYSINSFISNDFVLFKPFVQLNKDSSGKIFTAGLNIYNHDSSNMVNSFFTPREELSTLRRFSSKLSYIDEHKFHISSNIVEHNIRDENRFHVIKSNKVMHDRTIIKNLSMYFDVIIDSDTFTNNRDFELQILANQLANQGNKLFITVQDLKSSELDTIYHGIVKSDYTTHSYHFMNAGNYAVSAVIDRLFYNSEQKQNYSIGHDSISSIITVLEDKEF